MRIAFVWFWERASEILPYWRDGLRAAIELINEEHSVDLFMDKEIPEDMYDAYLIWGDSNCPALQIIGTYEGKKGLCLSTMPTNIMNLSHLDAVFCESQPVYEEVRKHGLRAIKAFGTDDVFFTPHPKVKKDIEYFYPATFSPWKRQHAIAHYGKKLLCVGTLQPDGIDEFNACKKHGVKIKEGYFPAEDIRDLYDRAKKVLIPAIHGSERTVLEAMSMGIVPEVNKENHKSYSYIQELRESKLEPREFVRKHYSAKKYAKDILKGLI